MTAFAILYLILGLFILYISLKCVCVAFCRKKSKLKAYEARMVADKSDNKLKRIEQSIYDDIKESAFCGNKYVKVFIDKDPLVSYETISGDLKRDGYKVSWKFSDDDDAYVFEIWW